MRFCVALLQPRALAAKVATAVANVVTVRSTGLQRFQMLYGLGILNFSKVPWDPDLAGADCFFMRPRSEPVCPPKTRKSEMP